MRAAELFALAGIDIPEEIYDLEVSGIFTDSREVTENSVFICLKGARFDGHDHIGEALEAGAAIIVAEKVRGVCVGGAASILVDNTRHSASLLYNAWYKRPSEKMKIVGVTGTNGKTSVTRMLYHIFEFAGYSCGLIGTVECLSARKKKISHNSGGELAAMTTPEPRELFYALSQMRDDGVEYVFAEVSSHGLVQCRTDAITFDAAVFTNLSEEHLDFHKNMEEYYKAKEKLFLQSRLAIVNSDDEAGRSIIRSLKEKGIDQKSCSLKEGDFCALLPRLCGAKGISYALKTPDGEHRVFLPISGSFQVMNSLQAAAVALSFGIDADTVVRALASMSVIPGRMESVRVHEKQNFHIFIDYAHTPDALRNLLLTVRELREKQSRIILLFGCGGERDRGKRRVMGEIASMLADLVIITRDNSRGEDPKGIFADILKGINKEKEYTVIENRREAIQRAVLEYAREGDILVLAGKGHEKYEIDADGKHYFDERECLREAFEKAYSV